MNGEVEVLLRVVELPQSGTEWGIYVVAGIAAVASISTAFISVLAAKATQERQNRIDMSRMLQSITVDTIHKILLVGHDEIRKTEFNALRLMAISQLPSGSNHSREIISHLNAVHGINSGAEFEAWKENLSEKISALFDEFWEK